LTLRSVPTGDFAATTSVASNDFCKLSGIAALVKEGPPMDALDKLAAHIHSPN